MMKLTFMRYIISIVFICWNFYAFSQIRLVNFYASKCQNKSEFANLSPTFKLIKINDSTLQIQTRIISNCIGVSNPRIKEYGPVLNLDFDDFRLDSINPFTNKKEPTKIQADCICSFDIKWDISGMIEDTAYVYLIKGRIFKNYNSKLLDEMLYAYKIDQDRLINVVDKNKNRQWRHESQNGDSKDISFYIDGILEK